MAKSLKSAVVVLLTLTAARGASAEDTHQANQVSTKAKDIRRLLELTGAAHTGEQIADQILGNQRRALPQIREAAWEELRKAFDTDEMLNIITAVWDKHLSWEDIRGLIAFYESPLGTRLRQVQPEILQESMAAGQAWGMRAFEKVRSIWHNEAAAIGGLRSSVSAQAAYSEANGGVYASQLECLASPTACIPGYSGPRFLGEGEIRSPREGYRYQMYSRAAVKVQGDQIPSAVSSGSPIGYAIVAWPVTVGETGGRTFCADSRGIVCAVPQGAGEDVVERVEREPWIQCASTCPPLP